MPGNADGGSPARARGDPGGGDDGGRAHLHPCVKGNEIWFRTTDGVRLVGHRFGASVRARSPPSSWRTCPRATSAVGAVRSGCWRRRAFSCSRSTSGARLLTGPARLRAPRGRRHRGGQGGARPRRAQGLGDRRLTRRHRRRRGLRQHRPGLDGVAAVSAPATIAGRLSAVPAAPRVRVPPSSSRPRTTRTPRTTSRPTRAGSMPRRPPRTRSSGRAGQPARRLPRGQAPRP